MLDYRYVYVFKVKRKDLYKIGISKDWKIRQIQIQDSKTTKLQLRILIALPLLFATFFERRLHKKFSKYHKPLKGVSGGTEFFSLKDYDGHIGLRGELLKYFLLQLMFLTFIFVAIGINLLGINWYDYLGALFKR